jgi:glycogen(starch) synthase
VPDGLTVVTPWYPSPDQPYAGTFVRAAVDAVIPRVGPVPVLHLRVRSRRGPPAVTRWLPRRRPAISRDRKVVQVDVPLPRGAAFAAVADAAAAALHGFTPQADVVHAHTVLPAGLAVVRSAAPGTRVVVTEHASYLARLLADAAARERYDEVLRRADSVLCVSAVLRSAVVAAFPEYAGKVRVVPNPVAVDGVPLRRDAPNDLLSWVYVGSLIERKGLRPLLDAFTTVRTTEPRATLSLVGEGRLRRELETEVARRGLGDAVQLHGAVPAQRARELLAAADLLVHPADHETFGMTVAEALAAQVPVLVTRCGGPEEILAGITDVAGGFVEAPGDGPAIVDAWQALRARRSGLDAARARNAVVSRYAPEVVADALLAQYRNTGD